MNTHVVVSPRTDEVRRHWPENLREYLAVLACGVVPEVVRGIGQGIGNHPVLIIARLVVIRNGHGAHERVGAVVQTARLWYDEAEMFCVWLSIARPE